MIFSLEVIRARKGDCLMLHYGTPEDLRLMMIDGGPRGVYAPHLKPRIADKNWTPNASQQASRRGNTDG
jgi:hypothetical protein